ncbi:MAG TPA: FCD domain-containing protein [Stellaceae bacterium]|nr:FCD domain-containing protein [Stellaceae bacterium]
MVMFENIKPLKAAQLIAQRIREAVISGELTVGDRLPPERELIKQFGYSRAAIREGLRLLEADGLIAMQAGRNGGAVICRPDADRLAAALDAILRYHRTTIHDVHEAQRLIEPLVIGLAIERATKGDLARVRRTIEMIERHPGDAEEVRTQSNLFHTLLAEATHNNVIATVSNLIRRIVIHMGYTGDEAEALGIARIHRRILEAIEAGDAAAANRRALRHLDASEGVLSAADGRKMQAQRVAGRAAEKAPMLRAPSVASRKLRKASPSRQPRRPGAERRGTKLRKR